MLSTNIRRVSKFGSNQGNGPRSKHFNESKDPDARALPFANYTPKSAIIVEEKANAAPYRNDKELLKDIALLANAMIPLHTLKEMRNHMQPRARVKWDKYLTRAAEMTTKIEDEYVNRLGPSPNVVPDLPALSQTNFEHDKNEVEELENIQKRKNKPLSTTYGREEKEENIKVAEETINKETYKTLISKFLSIAKEKKVTRDTAEDEAVKRALSEIEDKINEARLKEEEKEENEEEGDREETDMEVFRREYLSTFDIPALAYKHKLSEAKITDAIFHSLYEMDDSDDYDEDYDKNYDNDEDEDDEEEHEAEKLFVDRHPPLGHGWTLKEDDDGEDLKLVPWYELDAILLEFEDEYCAPAVDLINRSERDIFNDKDPREELADIIVQKNEEPDRVIKEILTGKGAESSLATSARFAYIESNFLKLSPNARAISPESLLRTLKLSPNEEEDEDEQKAEERMNEEAAAFSSLRQQMRRRIEHDRVDAYLPYLYLIDYWRESLTEDDPSNIDLLLETMSEEEKSIFKNNQSRILHRLVQRLYESRPDIQTYFTTRLTIPPPTLNDTPETAEFIQKLESQNPIIRPTLSYKFALLQVYQTHPEFLMFIRENILKDDMELSKESVRETEEYFANENEATVVSNDELDQKTKEALSNILKEEGMTNEKLRERMNSIIEDLYNIEEGEELEEDEFEVDVDGEFLADPLHSLKLSKKERKEFRKLKIARSTVHLVNDDEEEGDSSKYSKEKRQQEQYELPFPDDNITNTDQKSQQNSEDDLDLLNSANIPHMDDYDETDNNNNNKINNEEENEEEEIEDHYERYRNARNEADRKEAEKQLKLQRPVDEIDQEALPSPITKERIAIISFKLKQIYLSEVENANAQDNEALGMEEYNSSLQKIHTHRIVDIPPRWLQALKSVEWPDLTENFVHFSHHMPSYMVFEKQMGENDMIRKAELLQSRGRE